MENKQTQRAFSDIMIDVDNTKDEDELSRLYNEVIDKNKTYSQEEQHFALEHVVRKKLTIYFDEKYPNT